MTRNFTVAIGRVRNRKNAHNLHKSSFFMIQTFGNFLNRGSNRRKLNEIKIVI